MYRTNPEKNISMRKGADVMKNKKPSIEEGRTIELEITDLNHRGEGVGKADNFALFVSGALPGEKVRVKVTTARKNYAEASLISVDRPSEYRQNPPCPYFELCGGCQLQHLLYRRQLDWKQNRVAESLRRIAGIEIPVPPVIGMEDPHHYRNKAKVHFCLSGNQAVVGFYKKQSRQIIDIEECLVQHPLNNKMINAVRRALQNFIIEQGGTDGLKLPVTGAAIRTSFSTASGLVSFIGPAGQSDPKHLKKIGELTAAETERSVTGIVLEQGSSKNRQSAILSGRPYLEETITPFRFHISPQSFFQVNPRQAEVLYKQALALSGCPHTAFDLYCGTGSMALYLSSTAKQVIGVDSEESAVKDAKNNAALNNIDNVEFIHTRAEQISALLQKGNSPKVVFLNPPRRGCSPNLINCVVEAKPDRVVYISCNPATLARDLQRLQESGYLTKSIQPVDMFPHTTHVETIALVE